MLCAIADALNRDECVYRQQPEQIGYFYARRWGSLREEQGQKHEERVKKGDRKERSEAMKMMSEMSDG